MSSAPILVCGASRSGTSLVTQVLHAMGAFVGADLTGDRESQSVQQINRWIYLAAGAGLEYPEPVRALLDDALVREVAGHYVARAMRRNWRYWGWRHLGPRPAVWVLKDPRFTFTWPIWQDVFPTLRLVHVQRHGADVAASLLHRRRRVDAKWRAASCSPRALERQLRKHDLIREGRQIANLHARTWSQAFAHWQQYIDEAVAACQILGAHALTIRYEDLVARPGAECAILARFAGLPEPAAAVPILIRRDRLLAYRLDPHARRYAETHDAALRRHGYTA